MAQRPRLSRRDLLELLRAERHPLPLSALAELAGLTPGDLRDDLRHLERSLKHSDRRLVVEPARCRKCGFRFQRDPFRKPGKCPRCRGTWIAEPLVSLER